MDEMYSIKEGMSLRDYFAGCALQGMLANGRSVDRRGLNDKQFFIDWAFRYADAMISQREKTEMENQ